MCLSSSLPSTGFLQRRKLSHTSSTPHPNMAAFSCLSDVIRAPGLARPPSQTDVSCPRPTKGSELEFGTIPRRTQSLSCLWRRLKSIWKKNNHLALSRAFYEFLSKIANLIEPSPLSQEVRLWGQGWASGWSQSAGTISRWSASTTGATNGGIAGKPPSTHCSKTCKECRMWYRRQLNHWHSWNNH